MQSRIILKLILVGLIGTSCTGCMTSQKVWKDFQGRDPASLRVKLVDPSMPGPTLTWLESTGRSGTLELTPPLPGCEQVVTYLRISEKETEIVEAGKGDEELENYLRYPYPDGSFYRREFEAIPDARCGILLTGHQVDQFHRRFTEIHAATVDGPFYAAPIERTPHLKYLLVLPFAAVVDVITAPIQVVMLLTLTRMSH